MIPLNVQLIVLGENLVHEHRQSHLDRPVPHNRALVLRRAREDRP